MASRVSRDPAGIRKIEYRPALGHAWRVEVMKFGELLRRAGPALLRRSERLGFWLVLGVTRGSCRHHVDFHVHACRTGDWLLIAPGQVQSYDTDTPWDGVLVVVHPEFLLPASASGERGAAPWESATFGTPLMALSRTQHAACLTVVEQLRMDCTHAPAHPAVESMLRHGLYALLWRLACARGQPVDPEHEAGGHHARHGRFLALVETHHVRWHQVTPYAERLGCRQRTLDRSCMEAAAQTAKAIIRGRIALEAKRLLAYSASPIAVIGEQLGFSEATNFTKFFRREVSSAPMDFRARETERGMAGR